MKSVRYEGTYLDHNKETKHLQIKLVKERLKSFGVSLILVKNSNTYRITNG